MLQNIYIVNMQKWNYENSNMNRKVYQMLTVLLATPLNALVWIGSTLFYVLTYLPDRCIQNTHQTKAKLVFSTDRVYWANFSRCIFGKGKICENMKIIDPHDWVSKRMNSNGQMQCEIKKKLVIYFARILIRLYFPSHF